MSEEKKYDSSSAWFSKGVRGASEDSPAAEQFAKRIQLVEDAVQLKEPDRVPICTMFGACIFNMAGSSFKEAMYDFDKANEAVYRFYNTFQPDATTHIALASGKANEIAQSTMIDWPGRPGTSVPNWSTYQVIENEYMQEDEYPEVLKDFTGFMLRKYIPRAFPALKGLANISFVPSIVLNTTPMASLYAKEAQEAFKILAQIGEEDAKAAEATAVQANKLVEMGFPPMLTGAGEAPFDIIGDYYRGTLATLTDQLEYEEELEEFCDRLADIQIESWQYFKFAPLPVKRCFFPLHKGMDGFMSPQQYEKLYWKPLKKCMMALIDMGVTPFIYTEGKYNTRIEQLADIPKGKVIYHFEQADMERAKKILGDTACISGNLSIYLLEHGTKQQVIDATKKLLDTCAPGGGYIFDFDACLDNCKPENLEAAFDTVYTYGKK